MEKKGFRFSWYLPVKLIAALLCVLMVIAGGLFTAAAIVNDQMGNGDMTEAAFTENVYDMIASNYSAYVLEQITQGMEAPDLSATNFRYAVVKNDEAVFNDAVLGDPKNYIVGSPDDAKQYEHSFQGMDKAFYIYDISDRASYNLWDGDAHFYYDYSDYLYSEINQFVYAYDQGVFYFRTAQGDYPAKNICIAGQTRLELDEYGNYIGSDYYEEVVEVDVGTAYGIDYTRYHLERRKDPNQAPILCYIAEDDGRMLDVSQCENWREVGFYDNDWNWCAGFDVRFVRKGVTAAGEEASDTAQTPPVEIQGTLSDAAGGVNFFEDAVEETYEREPEEEAADTAASEPAEQILVTAPRDLTLKPVTLAQLKPVDPEGDEYSIYGRSSIRTRNPESSKTHYLVLSHVEDPKATGVSDLFDKAARNAHYYYLLTEHAILFEILCVICFLIAFVIFCCGVGHRPYTGQILLTWLDRVPFELVTIAATGLIGLAIGGCVLAAEAGRNVPFIIAVFVQMAVIGGLIGMLYLATILVRCKAHQFWKYTIVGWICHKIGRGMSQIRALLRENVPLFWQCVIVSGAALLVDFLVVAMGGGEDSAVVLFLFRIVHSLLFVWIAMQMARLHKGTRKLIGGALDQKIDTRLLVGPFKTHAEDINRIGDGLDEAVSEQMKSERLRTELITNVSHDIKTPLTSIINYVDLLQKLDLKEEQAQEYLEVLSRQSARLKKLIEDLMEASKASTGNLEVSMEPTDVGVLLEQAAGEFETRLAAKGLQLVVQVPEEGVQVLADGRHLWRIFENLFGNICKYAMENTRVYVTISREESTAKIIFRNVSAYQLNITPEELMERFVRGDSSRHTEGSGLGLSIAQSLTGMMNGSMQIDIDGDLFKVTLIFPL